MRFGCCKASGAGVVGQDIIEKEPSASSWITLIVPLEKKDRDIHIKPTRLF